MKRSKRYNEFISKVKRDEEYSVEDAVKLLKQIAHARFDETVEIAMRLGVDPRHADQNIRGFFSGGQKMQACHNVHLVENTCLQKMVADPAGPGKPSAASHRHVETITGGRSGRSDQDRVVPHGRP